MAVMSEVTKADMDIEVEVEQEEDEDDEPYHAQANGKNFKKAAGDKNSFDFNGFDFDRLDDNGIVRLTNELYDQEVYKAQEPWLIIFVQGLDTLNPYAKFVAANDKVFDRLIEMRKHGEEAANIKIAYVDTLNEGELIKETFDIDMTPSIRLISNDKVYSLKWVSNVWSATDMAMFVKNFETEKYLWDFKRTRITDGIVLSLEYVMNTLSNGENFNTIMKNYLWGRKFIEEWTGYKHDLSELNPNIGKKNSYKKSQIRTLLTFVIGPLVVAGTFVITLLMVCIITCLQKIFCGEKKTIVTEQERAKRD